MGRNIKRAMQMKKKSLKDWGSIAVSVLILGYLIYVFADPALTDALLKNGGQHIKAVIIDDKNYLPNHSTAFSYSYQFIVQGKVYTNDSRDEALRIGDSIEVEYFKGWPGFNRPVEVDGK